MFKKIMNKFQDQVKKDTNIIKAHKVGEHNRGNQIKIKIFDPKNQQEVEEIGNAMLSGAICHVKLNKFSENEQKQYLYFLLGVALAINWKPKQVDKAQYIFAPKENKA